MSKTLNLVDRLLIMARSIHRMGRREDARRLLERLTNFRDLPPAVAEETQVRLGRIALRHRAFVRARRHLTAALVYRPDSARYHYGMALALAFGGKVQADRADEHFRRSLDCEPQQPRCLAAFGRFCLRQGRTEEGLDLLRRAAELSPDDAGVLARLIGGLTDADGWDEAVGLARAARFRNPRDIRFRNLWNDLSFRQLHGRQAAERNAPDADASPVLLPFRRPAPAAASSARPFFRHDAASTLPAPHVLPRKARRTDWKHG
jgi:tetratricopeptide (TPR) repeat protein